MTLDLPRGTVLVLADGDAAARRLGQWVAGAGESPVLLSGDDEGRIAELSEKRIDLVVTHFDLDRPASAAWLGRMLRGSSFGNTAQLHLLNSPAERGRLALVHPGLPAISLVQPDAAVFQTRVQLAAENGRLRRELGRVEIHDRATGLFNRRHLLARLDEEFHRARRYRTPLSLVLFDLDRREDHESPDEVLAGLCSALRKLVRREDVAGRLGEACCGVLLPGTTYRGAAVLANNVRSIVEQLGLEGQIPLRVSAGISAFKYARETGSSEALLQRSEMALIEAKLRGGNRVFIEEALLDSDRRTILIADGDADLLDSARDLLALDDFNVVVVDSETAVLEALSRDVFDLMILDLDLLERQHDMPLLERIRHLLPQGRPPIIGTSNEHASDAPRLARLGIDRYMTKPFSISVLRGVARELLETFRTARAAV